MRRVNINNFIDRIGFLVQNIPDNIIFVGKINKIYISHEYEKLDLSQVKCNELFYYYSVNSEHILPKSLIRFSCTSCGANKLPKLPNSLEELICHGNELVELPELPKSLKYIYCQCNKLKSLPELPESLIYLQCHDNELEYLPKLPNSLKSLTCEKNKLNIFSDDEFYIPDPLIYFSIHSDYSIGNDNIIKYIPKLPENLEIKIFQNEPIEYFEYNPTLKLNLNKCKIIINGYNDNKPITNNKQLDNYMEYVKMSKIKSARK